MLFQSAAQTLLEIGLDPNRLGGRLGVTAVLHTWSRELWFHPHLHCIVTGGGLSLDGQRWVACRKQDYLLPVHALGALFRGKMLDALKAAHRRGQLHVGDDEKGADPEAFTRTVSALYRKKWIVYAKRPFGGPEQVLRYLGRYTHRVGLSNSRIRCVTDDAVTFATKTGKTITLTPHEFLRLLLDHVLPKRFVKIRHYGLLAPCHATTSLEVARRLLQVRAADTAAGSQQLTDALIVAAAEADWQVLLRLLTGIDLARCPACGGSRISKRSLDAEPRAPPQVAA